MAAAAGPAAAAVVRGAALLPGEPTQTSTMLVEKAAAVMQSFKPINRIHCHLCAFHFYAYDMSRQVEAHHYCTHYNQDMRQCAIFDSPEADARLIGVEYIISEKLFDTLSDEEKKLWHSHDYEVKGGILFMPGVPKALERKELEEVQMSSIWTSWISSRVVEKIFFCSRWKFSDFVAIHDHRAWTQTLFLYFSLSLSGSLNLGYVRFLFCCCR